MNPWPNSAPFLRPLHFWRSLVRAATWFSLQAICRDLQCIFINIDLKIRLTHNLVWTAFAVTYFCGLFAGGSAAAAQTADCLWAEHVLQVWLQVPLQLLANHEQVSAVAATGPVCCVFRPQWQLSLLSVLSLSLPFPHQPTHSLCLSVSLVCVCVSVFCAYVCVCVLERDFGFFDKNTRISQ